VVVVAVVMAAPPPQPLVPNCFTKLELMSSAGPNGASPLTSTVTSRDGVVYRTDSLNAASSPASIETMIVTSNSTTVISNWMNGTVTCNTFASNATSWAFPPLHFQGTGACGLAQVCNVWVATLMPGMTMTLKTLVANNDVMVEFDMKTTSPPSLMTIQITHHEICQTIDPTLFVVPKGLTCETTTSTAAHGAVTLAALFALR